MKNKALLVNAAFFMGMGVIALGKPAIVPRIFGLKQIDADMRNEVRAVYGGFGVAVAGLLFKSQSIPHLAQGIQLSIATGLLGMASGRMVSFLLEKPQSRMPLLFCLTEAALAGSLIYQGLTRPQYGESMA